MWMESWGLFEGSETGLWETNGGVKLSESLGASRVVGERWARRVVVWGD